MFNPPPAHGNPDSPAFQILRLITLPLAIPGLISAGIFSFTLSWNEFIDAHAFGLDQTTAVKFSRLLTVIMDLQ